ncbi:MAG: HNH endonuclease, partial [Planctomycetes bacterium]|nr:HNH endonuclease [Planctomycetota bacterium]
HDSRNISDDDILQDMRRVAGIIGSSILREREYEQHGKFAVKTPINRFGSWASSVDRAGLQKSVDRQISDVQLFENLLIIWTNLGEQPSYGDIQKPDSKYNVSTYERRFDSWRLALEAFVDWANSVELDAPMKNIVESNPKKQKTPRQANLRMRFRVLNRDRFTCCACGDSPAITPGTKLQVDHIIPPSKGGETIEENLQTLCERCNQGKSDLTMSS